MNNFHPTVTIGERVKLGENNVIYPNTVIYGPTEIGDDNIIGPNVVIGMPGQDTRNPRYDSSNCQITIGSRNIIREFTSIQKPCYESITILGDDIYLMQGVHIPHDAQISSKVVITPMCVLAGITKILEGANLGMGCTINQHGVVGQYSIVATGAAVMKNVKPFSRYIPNKPITVNEYAIKKFGFQDYFDEIYDYVMNDISPKSKVILDIVNEFDSKHAKSGRPLYR
ncbi:MAG: Acyl-(acyl-carrier-protein)--UDP-N-acetylglucosamine O-acyltransferase [Syntrophorhabdus sp. PtaU1.Bin002]|nr:MAG: Acyl-(acyl-carrier-protein)--UDP-N-acetylglucosamine O-acyltransferase [Syntrophorhabdus sp. PtaU1.Bin002]